MNKIEGKMIVLGVAVCDWEWTRRCSKTVINTNIVESDSIRLANAWLDVSIAFTFQNEIQS